MIYIELLFCLLLSATMSGLTLAILGLDTFDLQRKTKLGDKQAAKIFPVRKKGNWVLCTLLITNAVVNSAIPILLGEAGATGVIAGGVSAISIFIFGEILPQAVCNKYKLQIGSVMTPVVKGFMYITAPVTYPLSKLLDKILGNEFPDNYSQKELYEIINETPEHYLDQDEKKILAGGLTFSSVSAIKIMTPVNQVYALELNDIISLEEIKQETYSRIPVYEGTRDNIVGILYAKDLLGIKDDSIAVKDHVADKNLIKIDEKTLLDDLLNKMTNKKTHMSFLYDEFGVLRGIVTLEDIVETIINREIIDEHDQVADLQAYAKKEFNLDKVIEQIEEMNLSSENVPWATYGIGHLNSLGWVKLGQCSTEHLQAILDTQPHIQNTRYIEDIQSIIEIRKHQEIDSFSEKANYHTPSGVKTMEELYK